MNVTPPPSSPLDDGGARQKQLDLQLCVQDPAGKRRLQAPRMMYRQELAPSYCLLTIFLIVAERRPLVCDKSHTPSVMALDLQPVPVKNHDLRPLQGTPYLRRRRPALCPGGQRQFRALCHQAAELVAVDGVEDDWAVCSSLDFIDHDHRHGGRSVTWGLVLSLLSPPRHRALAVSLAETPPT